jgi:serine O-acetyltransferase
MVCGVAQLHGHAERLPPEAVEVMFDNIREDLKRSRASNTGGLIREFFHPGTQAVLVYRFGHWAWKLRIPIVRHVLMAAYVVLQGIVRITSGVNIATQADIGPGLVVHTWGGVFIAPAKIGKYAFFQHGVVLNWDTREIGDWVHFGPGSKVIRPVRIGHRARIGANAVVIDDVPDDGIVTSPTSRVFRIRVPRTKFRRAKGANDVVVATEGNGGKAAVANGTTGARHRRLARRFRGSTLRETETG